MIPEPLAIRLARAEAASKRPDAIATLPLSFGRALVVLLLHGDLPVTKLAELAGMATSGVSHVLRDDAERNVTRIFHPDDRRVVIVQLTALGRENAATFADYFEDLARAALAQPT